MAKDKGKKKNKGKGKKKKADDQGFAAGDPSGGVFDGERWDKGEDLDELVAFVNIDSADVDTEHGEATVASCDYIVILTGDNAGKVYEDQLVFGKVLAPAIYGADSMSGIVLGRMGQGEKSKGKNAPWLLDDPSKKDHKLSLAWFNKNAKRRKNGTVGINVDELSF